jgi:hypothetical protein
MGCQIITIFLKQNFYLSGISKLSGKFFTEFKILNLAKLA